MLTYAPAGGLSGLRAAFSVRLVLVVVVVAGSLDDFFDREEDLPARYLEEKLSVWLWDGRLANMMSSGMAVLSLWGIILTGLFLVSKKQIISSGGRPNI